MRSESPAALCLKMQRTRSLKSGSFKLQEHKMMPLIGLYVSWFSSLLSLASTRLCHLLGIIIATQFRGGSGIWQPGGGHIWDKHCGGGHAPQGNFENKDFKCCIIEYFVIKVGLPTFFLHCWITLILNEALFKRSRGHKQHVTAKKPERTCSTNVFYHSRTL